jgi:hypothetical protein
VDFLVGRGFFEARLLMLGACTSLSPLASPAVGIAGISGSSLDWQTGEEITGKALYCQSALFSASPSLNTLIILVYVILLDAP